MKVRRAPPYFRRFAVASLFRAAHRAFIMSESRFLPAAERPLFRFGRVVVALAMLPALRFVHRARCAAAILARPATDTLGRRDVDLRALEEG
jgi:hypothetical protein